MSLRSGFFDSMDGDRLYSADEMNRPYENIISNGVFPNPSSNLQVTTSSGMIVQVGEGGGMFGGKWCMNDAPILLTVSASETNLNRIDAIVMKCDRSEVNRNVTVYVKKGTPATDPIRPAMTHDTYVDEYCLATVHITKGIGQITQSMITDTRPDTSVCGWVTGLITQVDTETLFLQWQAAYQEQYDRNTIAFNAWFANLQDILKDDESAGAQIINLTANKADKKSQTVTLTSDGWTHSGEVYTQTVSVKDIAETDLIIVSPTVSSATAYAQNSIICTTQGVNQLTFQSNGVVAVSVIIVNMGTIV